MITRMAEAAGVHVLEAVSAMVEALEPHVRQDWDIAADRLTWSCHTTAAHIAHDLAAYSAQLASGSPQRYLPFDLVAPPDSTASDVLEFARAWGKVLAVVVD